MNDKLLKYYIETWGCQMNEEDSEKLSGMLKRIGYTRTENKEEAGIILFNTCCVRENAENKVFGNLGALKKLKKKNPDLIIGICGCMMQQEGMADRILKEFPYVNIVFGKFLNSILYRLDVIGEYIKSSIDGVDINSILGGDFDWRAIDIIFTRNIPSNDTDIASMVNTLKDIVSEIMCKHKIYSDDSLMYFLTHGKTLLQTSHLPVTVCLKASVKAEAPYLPSKASD